MAECPDCENSLAAKAKRCACGWISTERQEQVIVDHRCQYSIALRRCRSLGTVSPYPYGNAPWYCLGHWRTLNDRKLAEAILLDSEKNSKNFKN